MNGASPSNHATWVALLDLVANLRTTRGESSRTHLAHAAYFVQTLCEVPLNMVFYQGSFGPEGEDLCEELDELCAWEYLTEESEDLEVTSHGEELRDSARVHDLKPAWTFFAQELAQLSLADSMAVALALDLLHDHPDEPTETRVQTFLSLRAGVPEKEVRNATAHAEKLRAQAQGAFRKVLVANR